MKTKTGIYIRVSTEDQAKDGFSIHAQKEKLTKYAEANEWDIIDFYIDDGISGKNLIDRPEVTRLLKDVEESKINNILIYKLDRLTRSMKDLLYLIEFFEKNNCTFNSQTEKIDTSNAVGRMFVKIIGIFAEFERENLAERVAFGYEQKTREGNYTNTHGVYGYDYLKGGILKVNEMEKELVTKIFEDYINGDSYFKIAKKLNMASISTKRGGAWAPSTIKSILENPLYIGKVRYGVGTKNKHKSFITEGKDITPIIDEYLWEQARNTVQTRKHFCARRYPKENTYYYRFIKCNKCGGNMCARQQIQKGKTYITYRCYNSWRGNCKSSGFSHTKMEEAFIHYLENIDNLVPNKSILENRLQKNQNKVLIKKYENELEKLNTKKKHIRKQFIEEMFDMNEYRELIDEISKKEDLIKKDLEKIKIPEESDEKEYSYEEIESVIKNIKLNWEYLTNKEKQLFLERFIKTICVEKIDNNVIIETIEFNKIYAHI